MQRTEWYEIGDLKFEWDIYKASHNLVKHGVSFWEAATVFVDPLVTEIRDPDHSEYESRMVLIGRSLEQRMLVVVHVEREPRLRIISARPASGAERKAYEEGESR
ncbi:MAG TPA: BrnT family toxin [Acidobacteriaceae bacterium]